MVQLSVSLRHFGQLYGNNLQLFEIILATVFFHDRIGVLLAAFQQMVARTIQNDGNVEKMRRREVALAVLYIGEEPFGDSSFPADIVLRESEFFSARTDSGANI